MGVEPPHGLPMSAPPTERPGRASLVFDAVLFAMAVCTLWLSALAGARAQDDPPLCRAAVAAVVGEAIDVLRPTIREHIGAATLAVAAFRPSPNAMGGELADELHRQLCRLKQETAAQYTVLPGVREPGKKIFVQPEPHPIYPDLVVSGHYEKEHGYLVLFVDVIEYAENSSRARVEVKSDLSALCSGPPAPADSPAGAANEEFSKPGYAPSPYLPRVDTQERPGFFSKPLTVVSFGVGIAAAALGTTLVLTSTPIEQTSDGRADRKSLAGVLCLGVAGVALPVALISGLITALSSDERSPAPEVSARSGLRLGLITQTGGFGVLGQF